MAFAERKEGAATHGSFLARANDASGSEGGIALSRGRSGPNKCRGARHFIGDGDQYVRFIALISQQRVIAG